VWLFLSVVAAAAAGAVGWPAYRSSRARTERLLHEERYLAWRGRARQATGSPLDAYQADRDRRRLIVAAACAAIAAVCLFVFFVATG
jgi:hypothetical protein